EDDAEGSPTRLSCRQMLLDEETLTSLCEADPQFCRDNLPPSLSANYCARGDGQPGSADAGQ
ncbi:MAG: hypothetical protein L0Y64_25825, partial [Myxococcaceae bacterium]|nr:hypothetical protein [Myxococcaceae bacterium]